MTPPRKAGRVGNKDESFRDNSSGGYFQKSARKSTIVVFSDCFLWLSCPGRDKDVAGLLLVLEDDSCILDPLVSEKSQSPRASVQLRSRPQPDRTCQTRQLELHSDAGHLPPR
jgi:hypothetical protein